MVAVIDLDRCVNCGLCGRLCKYDAVLMEDSERKIDIGKCSGCGVCTSSCPSLALNLRFLPHKTVIARAKALLRTAKLRPEAFEPRVFVFACDWASRRGVDLGLIQKVPGSRNVRATKLTCMGALDPLFVVEAFLNGADGVLAVGCAGEDCNFAGSNLVTESKAKWVQALLAEVGLEPDRFKLVLIPLAEGRERFVSELSSFLEVIRELGPSPVAGPEPDEELRKRMEAAEMALSIFRLRALIGHERYLIEEGNAYGEKAKPEELWPIIRDALSAEYERARVLLALKGGPKSVRQLASELGIDAARTLKHITVLRARRLVELHGVEGTSPLYVAVGGA